MDTSPLAYEHVLRNMRRSRPSFKRQLGGAMDERQSFETQRSLLSPLFWLYRFIIRFTVGETTPTEQDEAGQERYVKNFSRSNRRYIKAGKLGSLDTGKILRGLYIEKLLYGGLTPTQRQEKEALISARGRVKVYRLRYWGTALQARAQLSCFDHGWWRMPTTSTVADGLWDVQLPPN